MIALVRCIPVLMVSMKCYSVLKKRQKILAFIHSRSDFLLENIFVFISFVYMQHVVKILPRARQAHFLVYTIHTMTADVSLPCVARTSVAMILPKFVWCKTGSGRQALYSISCMVNYMTDDNLAPRGARASSIVILIYKNSPSCH